MKRRLIPHRLALVILRHHSTIVSRDFDVGVGLYTVVLRLGDGEYLYFGTQPVFGLV